MSAEGCDRAFELADLYLAGELAPIDADRIDAHLAMCAVCRARVELDRRIRGAVRRAGHALVPSAELAHALDRALGAAQTRTTFAKGRRVLAAAGVLVALCAAGTWRWGHHSGWSHARDMAHKHVFYLDQQRSGWVVSSPDRAVLERWGSEQLGFATALPPRTRDMVVLGVRAERVDATPALLAFFRDRSGQPASLFIMAADEVEPEDLFRHLQLKGPDLASGVIREISARGAVDVWVEVWREGELRFALIYVTPDLVDAR